MDGEIQKVIFAELIFDLCNTVPPYLYYYDKVVAIFVPKYPNCLDHIEPALLVKEIEKPYDQATSRLLKRTVT